MVEDKKLLLAGETGLEGTEISSGIIREPYISSTILGEDYLEDWTIDTVNHMLCGDGQVSGVWKAIMLALLQGNWSIEPYVERGKEKPTTKNKKIAEDIGNQLADIWKPTLNEAVYYLPYGFSIFEVTMREQGGKIIWDRIAPRLQHTINKWESEKGHVASVNQYVWDDKLGMYRNDIWIPGRRILRFTNDQRGANFEGQSFMRGAYKHFLINNALYKISAIYWEKHGIGTIVAASPPGANEDQEKALKEILPGLRANEHGYVYLGPVAGEVKLEDMLTVMVPKGGSEGMDGLLKFIVHNDTLIARSMLAQFMSLGEQGAGTRSLSADMNDLFLMNLEAITGYISHIISNGNYGENRGIKDLVDINYGEVDGYPRWVCGRTKKTDSSAIGAVIAQLVQSGAMRPDDSLEDFLRGILGAPKDLINPRQASIATRTTQKNNVDSIDTPENSEMSELKKFEEGIIPAPLRRGRFPWEANIRFEEIRDRLDSQEDRIVSKWRDIFIQQIDAIGETVGSIVSRKDLEKIYSAEVPLQDELAEYIALTLQSVHSSGRSDVKNEMLAQIAVPLFQEDEEKDDEEILPLFVLQGRKAAERLASKTKQAIEAAAIAALVAAEEALWEDIRERAMLLSDQYARDESKFVNSAYGMGRNEVIAAAIAAGLVEERYYSAMFDACEVCAAMDGVKYSERPFVIPNPACLGAIYSKAGGNPCRCLVIVILEVGVLSNQIQAL